jgi:hypothetical protein
VLAIVSRTAGSVRDKPLEIVRGRSARLPWAWDGLCFGMPVISSDRDGLLDIVNNSRGWWAGADGLPRDGSAWTRDTGGNTTIDDSWDNDIHQRWPHDIGHDRPSTALTAMVRYKPDTTSNAFSSPFCMPHTFGSDPQVTWSIYSESVAAGMYGVITVNGTYEFTPKVTSPPTTEYVTVVLRWRSGQALTLDILRERTGSWGSASSPGSPSGTLSYNTAEGLRVNAGEDPFNVYGMNCSQALLWDRRLTDSEVAALVADPFGWYAPRREAVTLAGPFPVVAPPLSSVHVGGTSPYGGAGVAPVIDDGVPVAFTVTAGANSPAYFTRTVSGLTTTTEVMPGETVELQTGATSAEDVTYVGLETDDTGV